MKRLIAALICLCIGCSVACGDGYPFDPETQQVFQDSLRFRLTPDQIESISATGVVTLSAEQLTVVRRFYPAATPKQAVVAATFNDNNEGLDSDDVYFLWVRADELSITINHTVLADPSKAAKALSEPGEPPVNTTDLRLSPEGQLYHHGKPVSLAEAFRLIDAVERPKSSDTYFDFRIVFPPPYMPDKVLDEGTANPKVCDIFTALERYGEAQGVPVFRTW
jgi:hypothetical protein